LQFFSFRHYLLPSSVLDCRRFMIVGSRPIPPLSTLHSFFCYNPPSFGALTLLSLAAVFLLFFFLLSPPVPSGACAKFLVSFFLPVIESLDFFSFFPSRSSFPFYPPPPPQTKTKTPPPTNPKKNPPNNPVPRVFYYCFLSSVRQPHLALDLPPPERSSFPLLCQRSRPPPLISVFFRGIWATVSNHPQRDDGFYFSFFMLLAKTHPYELPPPPWVFLPLNAGWDLALG